LRDLWERVVLDRGEILRTVFPREGTKMLKMPEEIIRDVLGPGANAERQEGEVVTIPLKLALDLVNQRRKREHKERYYETNRDKYLEYFRRYREKNRERLNEQQRMYYWEHRDTIQEKQRQYREENRERLNKQQRLYYRKNRDIVLEKQRRYREENREKITQYQRQHYWANRERILERQRQYRKRNRETYGETPSHE
jgi:hypothetical protein